MLKKLREYMLKINLEQSIYVCFDTYFECTYLNLTLEDTISLHKLTTFHHKDLFDRMMIWQAIQHQLIFITENANILEYKDCGLKVIWQGLCFKKLLE